ADDLQRGHRPATRSDVRRATLQVCCVVTCKFPPSPGRSAILPGMNQASSHAGFRVGVLLVAVLGPGCGGETDYPESVYAQHCAEPRTGIDPATQEPYPDVVGTMWDEKQWIRAWIDDLYLWYREVPDLDVSRYRNPVSFFDDDKTMAMTASGKPKDQFH